VVQAAFSDVSGESVTVGVVPGSTAGQAGVIGIGGLGLIR